MTKAEHQKLAIKFKKENGLELSIPGKIVKNMPAEFLPHVNTIDTFLSKMCSKRENRSNAIVRRCYDVLRGFAERESAQKAFEYLYIKANAQDFFLQEYKNLKHMGDKVVTFTLNLKTAYMPKLPSLKYKIKWIKKVYNEYHAILGRIMSSPTYTLETQVEDNGQYQIHVHGFCNKEDYSILKAFSTYYGYDISKRSLTGDFQNYNAYITKDQIVTKRNRINSYKKIEDYNSVEITIATYKEKYKHIHFVNGELSALFKPLLSKEAAKSVRRYFRSNLKKVILKRIQGIKKFKEVSSGIPYHLTS